MKPMQRASAMTQLCKDLFGHDPAECVRAGLCPPPPYGCGKPVGPFRDDKSRREYAISSLCQACQDAAFAVPDEGAGA